MMLVGNGRNGKGVVLRVLRGMVGEHNCSALGQDAFRERFGLVALIGKLVNICGDAEFSGFDEGRLKALTGEDPITVDRKNKEQITFRSTAKLIFAANNPPKFRDRTEGIWRRLLLVPCDATVVDADVDLGLAARLEQTLPGIFNWAVEGLRRLRREGHFTRSAAVAQKGEELRHESDPCRRFLLEQCERHDDAAILTSVLQAEAKGWAAQNDVTITPAELGKSVRMVFGLEKKKRSSKVDRNRPWEYRGIRLKEDPDAA